jgi:hypothetical protein
MALPKFEDWKRPWKDEEFDAEKAAKLIYNLHRDKEQLTESRDAAITERDELKTKVIEFEEKDLSEVERLRKENERLKDAPAKVATKGQGSSEDALRADRLEIALEKGLTKTQAARLVGSTREELEADADAYIEEHGLAGASGEGKQQDDGKEGQAPPSQRAKVTTASRQRQEPADPDENLDPGKLYDKVHGRD